MCNYLTYARDERYDSSKGRIVWIALLICPDFIIILRFVDLILSIDYSNSQN